MAFRLGIPDFSAQSGLRSNNFDCGKCVLPRLRLIDKKVQKALMLRRLDIKSLILDIAPIAAPVAVALGAAHEYSFLHTVFGRYISVYDAVDLLKIAIEYTAFIFVLPIIFLGLEWSIGWVDLGITRAAFDGFVYKLYIWLSYGIFLLWAVIFYVGYGANINLIGAASFLLLMGIVASLVRPYFVESANSWINSVVLAVLFCIILGAAEGRREMRDNIMKDILLIKDEQPQYGRILRIVNCGVIFKNSNQEAIFYNWSEVRSFKANAIRR